MEMKQEDNCSAESAEKLVEKFLNSFTGGVTGKSLSVAVPLLPAVFSLPPELAAALGVIGVAYNGITNFFGCANLKRFVIEYFQNNIEAILDKHDSRQMETMRMALLSSLQCKKEDRIADIVAILSGVCQKQIEPLEGEDLINVAAELSDNEAMLLRESYRVFEEKERNGQPRYLKDFGEQELSHIDRGMREYILRRLSSKGLLYLETGAIFGNDGKTFLPTVIGGKLFAVLCPALQSS